MPIGYACPCLCTFVRVVILFLSVAGGSTHAFCAYMGHDFTTASCCCDMHVLLV